MLGRQHHRRRTDRLAIDIAQRYLALGVRQQALHRNVPGLAQVADGPQDFMRVIKRRRRQRDLRRGAAARGNRQAACKLVIEGVNSLHAQAGGVTQQLPAALQITPRHVLQQPRLDAANLAAGLRRL